MAEETATPGLLPTLYEYYIDYVDFIPVDQKALAVSKDSIVIIFWVSLAAFVLFLFLVLLCMSRSGSQQARRVPQRRPTCPWSLGLRLLLWVRRKCSWGAPEGSPELHGGSGEQSMA